MVSEGEILMKNLLDKGIHEIDIDWGGILSTALPVEDDVVFLIDAYRALNRFLAGVRESHDVFLGDGLLQLTARRVQEQVLVDLAHTPLLDRRLSQRHELRLSTEEYRAAWNELIGELVRLATSRCFPD